ncbi:MAG: glycerol-3-phosphate 1-O-acyltransferase PlsY [Bacilli bacterium]|nr:glycerol-3-phosphate 1-O-acyltransferase PlsY [Bacilli bacterium]
MNPIVLNLLLILGAIIIGYLIGSIPSGVVIGKVFYGKDPRDYGSHNSGGTNCGRVFGKKAGYSVIILDMLKTGITFWLVWGIVIPTGLFNLSELWFAGAIIPWAGVLFTVIGHCWSIFLKGFKGGKAVSCFAGSLASTSWLSFGIGLAVFFSIFLPKKIMSIASMLTAIIMTVFQWVMAILIQVLGGSGNMAILNYTFGHFSSIYFFGWWAAIVTTVMAVILIIRHSQNIARLRAGEEKPLSWTPKN